MKFASGITSLSNFINFKLDKSPFAGKYPFSNNNSDYLKLLSPNISNYVSKTLWSGLTNFKLSNWKFEYVPNVNGFNFNSLIKSLPPVFYEKFFEGGYHIQPER